MVARPCEASWELDVPSGYCVAPLRLGGLRGKQSTPRDWLGGTDVISTVDEGSSTEKERYGARGHHSRRELRQWYVFHFA